MGLTEKLLAAGGIALVSAVVRTARKEAHETQRRMNSPLQFDPRLTEDDFDEFVRDLAAQTPRVKNAYVKGMTVNLRVSSISGLSEWTAQLDFNDYGRLTGDYWLTSENDDSRIPEHFASMVRAHIKRTMSVEGASSVGVPSEKPGGTEPPRDSQGTVENLAAPTASPPPAGWYVDPYRASRLRWWDGRVWTGYVAP